MPASVICISRSLGAGGEEIGRAVAERLGYRHVDEDVIARAAAKEAIPVDLLADAERRRSFLTRAITTLAPGGGLEGAYVYAAALAADPGAGPSPAKNVEHYRDLIRDAIHETAGEGNVVIVSHASSIALAGRDGLLRVLVTAPAATRARRLENSTDIDRKAAEKAIQKSDVARADYLKRFYHVDAELPTHYDLVLNTDLLSTEAAADIVVAAAERLS